MAKLRSLLAETMIKPRLAYGMTYLLFISPLIFAPLAFGSVENWSLTILETACFGGVLVYFAGIGKLTDVYRIPGLGPLLLWLGFLGFQLLPLPSWLVKLFSPATFDLYNGTIGIIEHPAWITISVNPQATAGELIRFSAYAVFYVMTIQLLSDAGKLKRTAWIVTSLCGVISLQAIVQKFLDNGRVFWLREAPAATTFTGPYLYHNHFAGYVEMIAPIALVLYLHQRPRVRYAATLRRKLADLFTHTRFNSHLILGFSVVVMAASIVVSMSRGGMISFSLSFVALLVLLRLREKKRGGPFLGLFLLISIIVSIGWFGWETVDKRFGKMFNQEGELSEQRPKFWSDSIYICKDFVVAGTGKGTFGHIFPTYQTFPPGGFLYNAHGDYVETFAEVGLVGVALIAWFIFSVFGAVLSALKKRKDPFAVYLTLGSLGGVFAFLIHSTLDFCFVNPANGLYFFFLLALAVSAAHTRSRGTTPTRLIKNKAPLWIFKPTAVGTAAILLLVSLVMNGGQLAAAAKLADVAPFEWDSQTPQVKLRTIEYRLCKALELEPLNSYYSFQLADVKTRLGDLKNAEKYYKRSILLNPAQATYLQEFGHFLVDQGRLKAATMFFQAGITHDRSDPDRRREYAAFLLDGYDRDKGITVMRDVLAMDEKNAGKDIQFLQDKGISEDEIRRALPERVEPHLCLAKYLAGKGNNIQAESLYRRGLFIAGTEKKILPKHYYTVYEYFIKQQKYDDALDVMRKAIEVLPDHAELRVTAGDLYDKMGLKQNAVEAYQQAIAIDPRNRKALQALKKAAS